MKFILIVVAVALAAAAMFALILAMNIPPEVTT